METLKAGCFLINKKTKEIAIVYRERLKDYSFPKGHLEKGETLRECAIRETEEETKRTPIILDEYAPTENRYITPRGEHCVCYMYIALDGGVSYNKSEDCHEVVWTPFNKVEDILTHPNVKAVWRNIRDEIQKILNG